MYRVASFPPLAALKNCYILHRFRAALHTSFPIMTAAPEEAKFGSWRSPLSAELVATSGKRLGGMALDGEGSIIWLEGRPTEAGRGVLVQGLDETKFKSRDITPSGFNVRTSVHEYGGGAFTVDGDIVIFSNYRDQRLYMQAVKSDSSPVPLTPDYGGPLVRYADGVMDRRLNRYIAVREDHRQENKEPVNEIVSIQLGGEQIQEPEVLISGNDFYAFPRVSMDASKIAWVEWSHPNMPWDRTQLWIGDLTLDGNMVHQRCLAGGDHNVVEAPTEPKWSPLGDLFYISDKDNGFWNLYHWDTKTDVQRPLYPMEAEFARPAWVFGNSSYDILGKDTIVTSYRWSFIQILSIQDGGMWSKLLLEVNILLKIEKWIQRCHHQI